MKTPHIRTELPGPKARALVERDARVVSPSYPRDYPFVMSHGRGVEVWDVDGNRFLDFAAGIAVCSTGHCHPHVVAAIKEAADRFLHISSDYWHEGQVRLGERLAALAPMAEPAMSFFCQSGTESVEGALKLARYVTGRPRFIGFLGGFHGRTMGSLAFTSSKYTQQKGFFPTMPGVTLVPYPNPYRPLFAGEDQGRAVLDYIENVLFAGAVPPSEVAAVLVEPIQGEGGYLVPPASFLPGLRAAVRPPRHPADRRRGAVGHRPHRQDVRLPALGRGARHPDARQGPRLGPADRDGGREEEHHGALDARRPRQHLRRQPALLRGRARDARPRGRRLHAKRGRGRPLLQAAAARAAGAPHRDRRGARQGPDDRDGAREGPPPRRRRRRSCATRSSSAPSTTACCCCRAARARCASCRRCSSRASTWPRR